MVNNMTDHTYDYISLKPIAERFKEAANQISDEEIQEMVRSAIKKQINDQIALNTGALGDAINEWITDWLEDSDNAEWTIKLIKEGLRKKLT